MTVKAFPAHKHRKVVAAIAKRMAEQPTAKKAEEVLIAHLRVQWDHAEYRGIDPAENERDVLAFADAVQGLLSADQIVIAERAVASVTGRPRRPAPAPQQPPRRHEPLLHVEIARAKVIPFLPLRPRRYVSKLARTIVSAKTPAIGDVWLRLEMEMISNDLLKAGADPIIVKREVRALEASIRAEIWRVVLTPEDK